MWAAWVTGPATDDRRPARVPLDQPLPGKRRVRACLKRGAWQIVYKQGMRFFFSASEEGMSQVSTADGRAPCAPARRPSWRSPPRQTEPCTTGRGGATSSRTRCCRSRAPCISGLAVCVLDVNCTCIFTADRQVHR